LENILYEHIKQIQLKNNSFVIIINGLAYYHGSYPQIKIIILHFHKKKITINLGINNISLSLPHVCQFRALHSIPLKNDTLQLHYHQHDIDY